MVAQLRIYTINRGMMDSWLQLFNEHIRPLHDRLGIPVVSSWVNADRTEFIWIRRFNNTEEIPGKEAEYFASPERQALADIPTSHIAKMEVRVIDEVTATAGVA
ncbi:MAG: NIPSNAP family protein [Dehalococcoidia bacterium]